MSQENFGVASSSSASHRNISDTYHRYIGNSVSESMDSGRVEQIVIDHPRYLETVSQNSKSRSWFPLIGIVLFVSGMATTLIVANLLPQTPLMPQFLTRPGLRSGIAENGLSALCNNDNEAFSILPGGGLLRIVDHKQGKHQNVRCLPGANTVIPEMADQ